MSVFVITRERAQELFPDAFTGRGRDVAENTLETARFAIGDDGRLFAEVEYLAGRKRNGEPRFVTRRHVWRDWTKTCGFSWVAVSETTIPKEWDVPFPASP